MPNIRSAAKRMRQNKPRYQENTNVKRRMRQAIKRASEHITAGQEQEAREQAKTAQKAIDKAVKKGVIKKNTAARKKSQLMRRIENAFGAEKTGSKTAAGKSSSSQKHSSSKNTPKNTSKSGKGTSNNKKSGSTSAKSAGTTAKKSGGTSSTKK